MRPLQSLSTASICAYLSLSCWTWQCLVQAFQTCWLVSLRTAEFQHFDFVAIILTSYLQPPKICNFLVTELAMAIFIFPFAIGWSWLAFLCARLCGWEVQRIWSTQLNFRFIVLIQTIYFQNSSQCVGCYLFSRCTFYIDLHCFRWDRWC